MRYGLLCHIGGSCCAKQPCQPFGRGPNLAKARFFPLKAAVQNSEAERVALPRWVYYGRAWSPSTVEKRPMRRLIKPISTLLLVAIPMAVVDPALAETRTARNGEAVIEYQLDGKGPTV